MAGVQAHQPAQGMIKHKARWSIWLHFQTSRLCTRESADIEKLYLSADNNIARITGGQICARGLIRSLFNTLWDVGPSIIILPLRDALTWTAKWGRTAKVNAFGCYPTHKHPTLCARSAGGELTGRGRPMLPPQAEPGQTPWPPGAPGFIPICCIIHKCIIDILLDIFVFLTVFVVSLFSLFFSSFIQPALSRMVPPCKPGSAQGFLLLKGAVPCHCA